MVKQFDWSVIYNHFDERGIKESSQKQHIQQIKRVLKGVFQDKPFSLADVKRSLTPVLNWMMDTDNLPNHASRKNHFTSMYQFYKSLDINTRRMEKPFKEIVELAFAERTNGISQKSKEKFDKVDFKELQDKYKQMPDGDNRLMIALYSGLMPILRGEEWRNLKVITTKKINKKTLPSNYLLLQHQKLHIGDAKSKGGVDIKEIDVPNVIIDEIKNYLKHTEGDVLFKGLSPSAMTKRFNKQLGYSIQALRKRYVSEKVKEGLSPEERINLARIMGHNLTTQALDYDKKDELDDE